MPVLGIMVRSSLGSSPAVSTKEIRHQTQSFPRLAFGDGGGKKPSKKEEKKWKERGGGGRKREEEKTQLCEEHQAKGNSAESSSVVDMFYSPFAEN